MADLSGTTVSHIDTSIVQAAPAELPRLSDLVEKGSGDDFMSRLQVMAGEREQAAGGTTTLSMSALPALQRLIGPAEEHLREARRLIEQEEYAEALRRIDDALAEVPGHYEAIYMQALCLARLGEVESALRVLAQLRGRDLPAELAARVGILRDELRNPILQAVFLELLTLMLMDRTEEAVPRLRELCELDPEAGMLHFLLAGTLMSAERLEEAAAAADNGLRLVRSARRPSEESAGGLIAVLSAGGVAKDEGSQDADDELAALEGIRSQIRRRLLVKEIEPARRHYRKGKFRKARSDLQRVDPDFHQDPMWASFDGYLEELDAQGVRFGRRNGASGVVPRGSADDLDALHFFLVGEEIGKAKAHLSAGNHGKAESEIDEAMKLAPHFPYAHFLKARCMYVRLGEQLAAGKAPDLDALVSQLEEARARAEFAMRDPDLEGSDLPGAIDAALDAVRSFQQELDRLAEDAEKLNPVIDELHAIMKLAERGIDSTDRFREIDTRMKELQKRVSALGKSMKSEMGTRAQSDLKETVDEHCRQLDKLPSVAEIERVKALQNEFVAIMNWVSSGISRADLPEVRRRLEALFKKAADARTEVDKPDSAAAIDELLKALASQIQQVHELMGS